MKYVCIKKFTTNYDTIYKINDIVEVESICGFLITEYGDDIDEDYFMPLHKYREKIISIISK